MSSTLKEWDEKEFNKLISEKRSGVVDFRADWCHACALVEPFIAEVAAKHSDITFCKIDVAKNPALASKMGVMSLPNILVISNGKVVEQIIGATTVGVLEDKIKKIK